jgi:hypothetical protein
MIRARLRPGHSLFVLGQAGPQTKLDNSGSDQLCSSFRTMFAGSAPRWKTQRRPLHPREPRSISERRLQRITIFPSHYFPFVEKSRQPPGCL